METNEFKELKEGIAQLQSSVTQIQTDLTTVQTDLKTVQTDLKTVQTDLKTVQTDLKAVQSELSEFKTDVANDFKAVNERLDILEEGLSDNNNLIRIHNDILVTLSRDVAEAKKTHMDTKIEVAGLIGRMNHADNSIRVLQYKL